MKKNNIEIKKNEDEDIVFTADELEQINKMEEVIEEIKTETKTNLLDMVKFKNKSDLIVFDKLPLTDFQKEDIMIDILIKENPNNLLVKEYYDKIKNISS
jgi:hypothetical protein